MSGGRFDYKQYVLGYIADQIEEYIVKNGSNELDEWGDPRYPTFAAETITEFTNAVRALRTAEIYAQRVDWLLSGDDGEDSFHSRLRDELTRSNR
jgi:hypothetical protein